MGFWVFLLPPFWGEGTGYNVGMNGYFCPFLHGFVKEFFFLGGDDHKQFGYPSGHCAQNTF